MATTKRYDVKDLALATEGKRRIEGADRQMPVLAAIRDRIRGIYAISPELPLRNAARAAAVLKNYNVLTSMGSAALSSLPCRGARGRFHTTSSRPRFQHDDGSLAEHHVRGEAGPLQQPRDAPEDRRVRR